MTRYSPSVISTPVVMRNEPIDNDLPVQLNSAGIAAACTLRPFV